MTTKVVRQRQVGGEMEQAPFAESPESQPPPPPDPQRTDKLAPYRDALAELAASTEKLATLSLAADTARTGLSRLESEHEEALSQAASGDIDADTLGELGELKSRTEIYRRKISDLGTRIADAQSDLARQCSALSGALSTLWRAFYQHSFEQARSQLADQLDGTLAVHLLDLAAMRHKSLVSVRALEIIGTDPETLLTQGTRLVESVSGATGFNVPACSLTAPGGLPGVAAQPAKPKVYGPWADRGMSSGQINDALYRIRIEHPEFTLGQAGEELQRLYPQLYISEAEFMAMNQPISQPVPPRVTAQEAAA